MIRRSSLAFALLLAAAGCSHKIEGPAPSVSGLDPQAACNAQIASTIAISGSTLSPLVTKSLTPTPQLVLPTVTLSQTQDLAGGSASGDPVQIPDDPAQPDQSRVRWTSQEAMSFDVFPELGLASGLFTVTVANGNGQTVSLPDSFLTVPPPTLQAISPDLLCADKENDLTLSGDLFVWQADKTPTVVIGSKSYSPKKISDCRALPGPSGLLACKTLVVTIHSKDFFPGNVQVKVINPAPVGCQSTESVVLTLVPEPTLATVIPDLVCTAQGDNPLTVSGTGFIVFNGSAPTLTLGTLSLTTAPVASSCTLVVGPKESVQSCTTLTAKLAQNTLSPGNYPAVVHNPAPADCSTAQSVDFTVVPPPVLTSVVPDLVCNAQGAVNVTLNGTGFLSIATGAATSLPTVTVLDGAGNTAFTETNPLMASCAALPGPLETVQSCAAMQIAIPPSLVAAVYTVKVQNPAPAGCSSQAAVSLTLAPPPSIASIAPDLTCAAEGAITETITGTGFLTIAGVAPTVTLTSTSGSPTSLIPTAGGCAAIPSTTSTASTCTSLQITVPMGMAPGSYAVSVANPAPAGCVSASGPNLVLLPPPTIVALSPKNSCTSAPLTQLNLIGSGFLRVPGSGAVPSVNIGSGATLKTYSGAQVSPSGCAAVTGTANAYQLCTALAVTLGATDFQNTGSYPVVVTNPQPSGCSSTQAIAFDVVSPPVLTTASPSSMCAGGGQLFLTGSNFATSGATVTLTGTAANSSPVSVGAGQVQVAANGQSATAFFSAIPVSGANPYDVHFANALGCEQVLTAAVAVTSGPQLFFASPPVVFNGIDLQITLYGKGFSTNAGATPPVVRIRPVGGGALLPLAVTYSTVNPNQVLALVPKGTVAGSYDVLLNDATSCQAVLPAGLSVVSATTLSLSGIDPPFGWTNSSTGVTVSADPIVGGGLKPVPWVYLSSGGQATPLTAITVLSSGKLTALVPTGLTPGTYDLVVLNPDGGLGVKTGAFTVTSLPPPTISDLTPGSVPNQSTTQGFTVLGANFRQPAVGLTCLDFSTGVKTAVPAIVASFTPTSISATFNAKLFNNAVCVVRVTDQDNGTYADFSALTVTNPAMNLGTFTTGPSMLVARRALVAASGRVTSAARFLYAIGGDDGAATPTSLSSVESTPVDTFGGLSPFFSQTYGLQTPRAFAGIAKIGRFLYVAGGTNGTTALNTVERSYILDPAIRPEITTLDLEVNDFGTGLTPGVWYYRVAPVMGASDPFNPNGEGLPSDGFPVLLPNSSNGLSVWVTLTWKSLSGAVQYRIYRSPTANAAAGSEQLLATVPGGANPTYSFQDQGLGTQAGTAVLPIGSTGTWQTLTPLLSVGRQGPGVAMAIDPVNANKAYLYVLGGRDGLTATSNALKTYEFLDLTLNPDGSQTVGTFSAGTAQLSAGRWQIGAYSANNSSASRVSAPNTYIYAAGGIAANGVTSVTNVDAGLVQPGGQLGSGAPLAFTAVKQMSPMKAGYGTALAANFLFAFGGSGATPSQNAVQAEICGPGVGSCNSTPNPPYLVNWNTATSMSTARYLMGSALESAFIYILGGTTNLSAATNTVESTYY